jgi:Phosphotransferase enzyme family
VPRIDETPGPPPRRVRLVLITRSGELLGALPPFPVATPWWQEAGPIVRSAREHHNIDVTVLRVLETPRGLRAGGELTYLAETDDWPRTTPWSGSLEDDPLRQSWASPGGPDRDVAWADSVLAERGLQRVGAPEQVRSWNLSSLWRLPLRNGNAWLKVVPPFMRHEGAILEQLAGGPVPPLLGHDGARILMPELSGDDLYDAQLPVLSRMPGLLVDLQAAWIDRTDELLALGLPDWRGPALTGAISDVIERTPPDLPPDDRATLARFVDGLPDRFGRLAAAGLPDTLVHGDFHPGNFRGDDASLVLLDWGDSGVGHPLLDQSAFLDRIPSPAIEPIRDLWERHWLERVPPSRPADAATLLRPVATARQAVIYRKFLDNIEPSEHPYHERDPADWLRRTAELVRAEER